MKPLYKALSFAISSIIFPSTYAATDLVLINGKIFTANAQQEHVQALAIEGDHIQAVGTNQTIKKLINKNTQVIDLKGKSVFPGMIDSHSHAVLGGIQLGSADLLDEILSTDEIEKKVNDFHTKGLTLSDGTLKVLGVNGAAWVHADELNQRFNQGQWHEAPLALMGSDYHTGWANDVVLKKAGINKQMIESLPKAEQHNYGRLKNGEPNGLLVDAAWDKVSSSLPKYTEQEVDQATERAVAYNNRYGITAWMDPAANVTPSDSIFSIVPTETTVGILPGYKNLSQQGKLNAHVVALLVMNSKSTPKDIEVINKVRQQFQNVDHLYMSGVKIFADGILRYPMQSAAVLQPYKNSNKRGELLVDENHFGELVTALDKQGLIVHVHAIGDRAVRETLNAVEQARQKQQSNIGHSITHMQLVSAEDIPRFKALNVYPSMQLAWAAADEYRIPPVKPYIDEKAFELMYPVQSLKKAGAIIAGASDWPDSPPNPWLSIQQGITREGSYGVLNANERLERKDMFYAYTLNAAKLIGLSNMIGSLENGKKADFIILDRDVFNTPTHQLKDTEVLKTYFGGKLVYSK